MSAKDERPADASRPRPVELLNTDAARIYTHVHPVLVLALFYTSFSSLVADPVATMISLAPPLCLLQALYMVVCLPPTQSVRPSSPASPSSGAPKPSSQSPTPRRKPTVPSTSFIIGSRIIPTLLSITITVALAPAVLTFILVLHGAPLTTHLAHTSLCALHMSLLSALPLFYVHGISGAKWQELAGLAAPLDEVLGAALGTLVGTWAGAVPIPLDWDREWQKWPVTLLVGAYAGWAVGRLLGATLLKGRVVPFLEEQRGRAPSVSAPSSTASSGGLSDGSSRGSSLSSAHD